MGRTNYHNLDGWLRDVQRAVAEGDDRAARLTSVLEELLDLVADDLDDVEDDVDRDDAGEHGDSSSDGEELLSDVGGSTRMGDPVPHRGTRKNVLPDPVPLAGTDRQLTMFASVPITHGEVPRRVGRRGT